MSGSENTKQWDANACNDGDVVSLSDAVKADLDALAEKIEVQADITGQLGASFHALRDRVAALEGQSNPTKGAASASVPGRSDGRRETGASSVPQNVSPAPSPPAPLVERMAKAIVGAREPGWPVMDQDREVARAALRVAAEDPAMLGDVVDGEVESIAGARLVNDVLRRRLAAALEACR